MVITSPSDERLLTKSSGTLQGTLTVRAKFWGKAEAVKATVHLDGQAVFMKRIANSMSGRQKFPLPARVFIS